MQQLTLFERATATSQIEQTIAAFQVAADYKHWQISFSGGKDSTALVTLTIHLIEEGLIPRPQTLVVMYADTRMELPPLHASAMRILERVREFGWGTQVVQAPIEKRFLPYILGRGVPAPNNTTMRWCTRQIKLDPMRCATQELYAQHGERFLSLNGVRVGESAIRDARIALSCSRSGSECGQGWFQRDLSDSVCDKLSPIVHWRVCSVWDWLMLDAPRLGFQTELLAEVYGGDEAVEINARTGCMGCPLASRDLALENLVKQPEWAYYLPLLELKGLLQETRLFSNRHKKDGERNKSGKLSANPSRVGPLTLESRIALLEKAIDIQCRVNHAAAALDRPGVDFLNNEEIAYIRSAIASNLFPDRWDGNEPLASELLPEWSSDGSVQLPLWGAV
jgi:DNA sulfur modification protein DndC